MSTGQQAVSEEISDQAEGVANAISESGRLVRVGILIAFIFVWYVVTTLELITPLILPSPVAVIEVAITDTGTFLSALQVTLFEVAIGIGIAWMVGIALGIGLGSTQFSRDVFRPVFASLFAVPFILLYPIFLAWFGIGSSSKILFGAAYGMYPIILNTMAGMGSVDEKFRMAGRSMGASRIQILSRIMLPLAVPSIISGLRIGTALVVIGVVVTEMLASTKGLGFLIRSNQTVFNTAHVYLAIFLSLVIVLLVNRLLTELENRTEKWRHTPD
jgi:NitT/TauT family transport system permease protein/taurine transport system permease protein